jgi:hypothetical protein
MIEVPQQDEKVTWIASLFYHTGEQGNEQSFSHAEAQISRQLGARTREALLPASRVSLCSPSTMQDAQGLVSLWELSLS